MTIRVQAPSNPVPIGTTLRTPCGRVGTVVDYECPGGVILYVVRVPHEPAQWPRFIPGGSR